jgi:hypothetical protein
MKIKDIKFNLLIISILMLITAPAYAYLDSGTGSVIIQMLFAGIAGLLAILKLYWEKAKASWRWFCHLFKRKQKPESKPVSQPTSSLNQKSHHDKTR